MRIWRFTPERKTVLDALADELRKHNLLPIIFDFERSTNRDFTETVKILAGLSLFVIGDLTKPKSAPQEVTATVPDYQIPFVPILAWKKHLELQRKKNEELEVISIDQIIEQKEKDSP